MVDRQRCLPNFFLVGAPRCGTTALSAALQSHPRIVSTDVKEPNFFNTDISFDPWPVSHLSLADQARTYQFTVIRDFDDYKALFQDVGPGSLAGDYSVNYLRSKRAPAAIKALCPDAKILVMLRNPVPRALSHWRMDRFMARMDLPFSEAIRRHVTDFKQNPDVTYENYIRCGVYDGDLRAYRNIFGAENIHIILHEDFRANPMAVLGGVLSFLGLTPAELAVVEKNAARIPKSYKLHAILTKARLRPTVERILPTAAKNLMHRLYYRADPMSRCDMNAEDKTLLRATLRPSIESLSTLLNQDLTPWLA